MQFLEDPSEMTAEQRLTEIASILAAGVRRVRSIDTILGPQESPSSAEKRLDEILEPRLHENEGLTLGRHKEVEHEGSHSSAS